MINELSYEKNGENYEISNMVSAYQPPDSIKEVTEFVKSDYQVGDDNLNASYDILGGDSIIQRSNLLQRNWNNDQWDESEDPEEDWRWFGTRPTTRNKIISTAAHLTQTLLMPAAFAQNDQDEEDKEWGQIAQLLLRYNIDRSHYDISFLYGVISGLVNVVSYFTVDYQESYMEAWNLDFTEKETVKDDEHSGFQYGLASVEDILFDNPYQFFLQKQRFTIHRKKVSYDTAQALYGDRTYFTYVTPGLHAILGDDGIFYDVEDNLGNLVEIVIYRDRRNDAEIHFVNGIYVGNDNVSFNPFVHRTNKNKPKYPLVKFGVEPIDEMKFIGYKSLADKLLGDQELTDRQWQLAMDASYLQTLMPTIITGGGKVDKGVMVPSTVTSLKKDAKVYPLNSNFDSSAAFNALHEAERSMSESSVSPQMGGDQGSNQETRGGRILLQENAEKNLGIIGKMIGFMVKEVGGLMLDDIIRYQTVAESLEIIGDVPRAKYKTFLVENNIKDGKNKTAVVRLTDRFAGIEMTEEEIKRENLRLRQEAGDNRDIFEVNPGKFARLNFLISMDVEQMLRRNTAFEKAFKLEVYDRAILDPNIAQDLDASLAITRDFLLEPLVGGDTDKYMPKPALPSNIVPPAIPADQNQKAQPQQTQQDIASRLMRSVAMESAQGGTIR